MLRSMMMLMIAFTVTTSHAGQIKPENSSTPSCYTGDVWTAFDELLNGDYDPVFSDGSSYVEDGVIFAVQFNEEGDEVVTRLPKCD